MYTKEFNEIVDLFQSTYIGMGNPKSKILILGKECAIDAEANHEQHKNEIHNNAYSWRNNIKTSQTFDGVDDWFNTNILNPLHPYKGQRFLINPAKGGTSSTWYYYQKLFNLISAKKAGEKIDFFDNCFISELSDATAKSSNLADNELRKSSIIKRCELFKTDFFQQFPIVIIAAGHYCRDFNIDIEELFGVKWVAPTININNKWVNIHYNNNNSLPKLLIHTNQLSMVSNELLEKIADVCSDFINKNNIRLS